MQITAYDVAARFLGTQEGRGDLDNPLVVAMLQKVDPSVRHDATAWCAAFVGFVCWLLGLPLTRSLSARRSLTVGEAVSLREAVRGFDIVVLTRGDGPQPGPHVLDAPGHVGFFHEYDGVMVSVLGGNQADGVNIQKFPASRVLGIRRLAA